MNIWDKAVDITSKMASKLIHEQCSLEVSNIKILGQGYDNTAFLVNDKFVFRFPHREEARILMENEKALLPKLCSKVSFYLPNPIYFGEPNQEYPYPFVGYKIIEGQLLSDFCEPLLDSKAYAKNLALWIKELHDLPVDKIFCDSKQKNNWRLDVKHRMTRVQESLQKYSKCFEQYGFDCTLLEKGMKRFEKLDTTIQENHYVHGDLYAKHILVNKENLPSGIIDWGDAHVGHPSLDLGIGFMIFSNEAQEEFFNSYGSISQQWKDIALFRAYFHPILSLPYFVSENDEPGAAWAAAALKSTQEKVLL